MKKLPVDSTIVGGTGTSKFNWLYISVDYFFIFKLSNF